MIWKKVLIPLVLCTVTSGIFSNCSPATEKPTTDGEVVETPVPVDIDASSVDVLGETWRVTELTFESNKEYNTKNAEQFDVVMDAKFTNKNSGTTLTIPAFGMVKISFVFVLLLRSTVFGNMKHFVIRMLL